MGSLGTYWSVWHRRQQDYLYFKELQPSTFLVMDGGTPDYQWITENLPASLVLARSHSLSEEHDQMLKDPSGTGKRHAREWNDKQKKLGFDRQQTLILGINEPTVWVEGYAEALRLYTIALCAEATHQHLRVGAMQFGVGWPGNNGPDKPPDWSQWRGVEEAINRNGGALICHEYWADRGPGENWGWWAGRTLKCPWQVPIIIGECGVDMYVKDAGVSKHKRGWRGQMEAHRYAQELGEYVSRMNADPRFVGCCVFATDYADETWYSFDTEPAHAEIVKLTIPKPQPPEPQPPDISPPQSKLIWPVLGEVTQWFGENPDRYLRFGEPGHNGIDIACESGTNVRCIADGEVMYVGWDKDYGNYCRVHHPSINSHSFYAHNTDLLAMIGSQVKQGDTLARSGSTGNSSGPHCHLELRGGSRTSYYPITTGYSNGRYNPLTAYLITGSPLSPETAT